MAQPVWSQNERWTHSVTGLLASLFIALASESTAQLLTIGNQIQSGSPADPRNAPAQFVDLASPASASGFLNEVTVAYSAGGGESLALVRVFRRSANQFRLIGERGPFNILASHRILIDPPLEIEEGDFIGIALPQRPYGDSVLRTIEYRSEYLTTDGWPATFGLEDAAVERDEAIGIWGTGTATIRTGAVVPVVADAFRAGGSEWRTTLRSLVRGNEPIDGEFRLLRFGHPGGDPADRIPFHLDRLDSSTETFDDLEEGFGEYLGSLDIRVPADVDLPRRTDWHAEIQEWSGCGAMAPVPVIPVDERGFLGDRILVTDTGGFLYSQLDRARSTKSGRFRTNLGIRTFETGAVVGLDNCVIPQLLLRLPPNSFSQWPMMDLCGGENAFLYYVVPVMVWQGAAIVYITTIDEETGAVSIQFAKAMVDRNGDPLPRRCE